MTLPVWIGVALLGGVGALARFLLDGLLSGAVGRAIPLGTFAVNLSGAFLLGLLTGLSLSATTLTLAGTATIGSYTTFSTWMLETHRLRDEGEFGWAAANLLGSLAVGLGAAALGRWIAAHG